MKKVILSILILSLLLAGCTKPTNPPVETGREDFSVNEGDKKNIEYLSSFVWLGELQLPNGFATKVDIVEDQNTKCQYIITPTSFSPYIDESGKVKGCKSATR